MSNIYHKHHIIPKHMGGTDDPSNLVELTVEEHAEAHRKLFEEHGRWQDELAWKGLAKPGKEAAQEAHVLIAWLQKNLPSFYPYVQKVVKNIDTLIMCVTVMKWLIIL